jgi:hypothetical protein
LCATCSTLIDKDEASFPFELLLEWKRHHEAWINNGGIIPCLPELSLKTLQGRTLPDVPTTITLGDCAGPREHWLRIRNVADAQILMIDARVQLPEPIVETFGPHKPAGTSVAWRPDRPQMVALLQGRGTVTRGRPPLPANVYQLQIDRLAPSHQVEIGFVTSTAVWDEHDLSLDRGPFGAISDPTYVRNFIDGTFQFEYRGAMPKRRFFAPIQEDKENRRWSIMEVREDFGQWKPLEIVVFS